MIQVTNDDLATLGRAAISTENINIIHPEDKDARWWRSSAIYQIYPRSFKDSSGDGIGDLPGITSELHSLSELGVDAVWLSPFYKSPQKDGGYDVTDYCDVDPLFGTLDDFDDMVAEATKQNLKVIIDLVPNHCSNQHVMFQAALHAAPYSPEREMFIFRDGQGENGEFPPNNWQSHFEGSAWTRIVEADGTPGQWYLHLFDTSQPDWNWDNPKVHEEFERVLRFWLDRGVSGFRVDVAHALVKKAGLPDWGGRADGNSIPGFPGEDAPMFGQEKVHEIYRSWRKIVDSYDGDRILCAEANVDPLHRMAQWVREDEMQQAFNFSYLHAGWNADQLRTVISNSLDAFDSVKAPTTWVLSNHDGIRHATRFGVDWHGDGIGPNDPQPNVALGLSRARAASLLMLALPGGVYLYQGEELGLPDNTMIPPEYRQDPSFFRSNGERIGRDGCRVPLPWTRHDEAFGFSATGSSWLPQPEDWDEYSREAQRESEDSTLSLYKKALRIRKDLRLGAGSFAWVPEHAFGNPVVFANNDILVIMNMSNDTVEIPYLPVVVGSEPGAGENGWLKPNQTVWLQL